MKTTNMLEVYDEVTAVISPRVISSIQEIGLDVLLTLHKHIHSARPSFYGQNQQYTVTGSFSEITCARKEFRDMLMQLKSPVEPSKQDCVMKYQESASGDSSVCNDNNQSLTDGDGADVDPLRKKSYLESSKSPGSMGAPYSSSCSTFSQNLSLPHLSAFNRRIFNRKFKRFRKSHSERLSTSLEKMKLSGTENSSDADKLSSDQMSDQGNQRTWKDFDINRPFKYFCQLCSFRTERSSHLQKHMLVHAKGTSLHKCRNCSFTSVRRSHLRRHEVIHSSTVKECMQCNYKTDDVKLLLRHIRLKHLKASPTKYDGVSCSSMSCVNTVCPDCPNKTAHPRCLERHKLLDRRKIYNCRSCSYKTNRTEHYYRHVRSVHVNERNFLCHLCGKTFKRGDTLQQHQQTHEKLKDADTLTFKCDTCQKSFKTHSNLIEHKAVHNDQRLFLCEICGVSFKTRSVQRKHILSIHKNPRSYSCKSCTKCFNTSYAMKRHQKVHMENNENSKLDPTDALAEKLEQVAVGSSEEPINEPAPRMQTLDGSDIKASAVVSAPLSEEVCNSVVASHIAPTLLQNTENTATVVFLTSAPPLL